MADNKIINGVDVKELFSTIDAIKGEPEIAKFKFRATNKWVQGTHNRATLKDFYGALREDTSRKPIVFEIDELIQWSIFSLPYRVASQQASSLRLLPRGSK